MTPPEVARTGGGAPDSPGWQVRVVPNMYPIVGDGVAGAHEVIVLSPAHDASARPLVTRRGNRRVASRCAIAPRITSTPGLVHAQPMLNQGKGVGRVDRASARAARRARLHATARGSAARSLRRGRQRPRCRRIRSGSGRIVPRRRRLRGHVVPARVEHAVRHAGRAAIRRANVSTSRPTTEIGVLTACVAATRWHDSAPLLGEVAYNVVVNTAPRDDTRPFHWWVDIVPRVYGIRRGSSSGPVSGSTRARPSRRPQMLRDVTL